MARVALLTVHGQGRTARGYADPFIAKVRRRLPSAHRHEAAFQQAFYQEDLEVNQDRYYQAVRRRIQSHFLRGQFLFGFSDASSLQVRKEGDDSAYYKAQRDIRTAFQTLYQQLNTPEEICLVVVADSLGGQVMSNYLWDAQVHAMRGYHPGIGIWQEKDLSFSDNLREVMFCRGYGIHTLITTGCNIPLFVAGHAESSIQAIPKPNDTFRWLNYFDDDDPLGWPLRPLSDSYEALVEDKEIRVGFSPLTHMGYWSNGRFIRAVAKLLTGILEAEPSRPS